MDFKFFYKKLFFLTFLLFYTSSLFAQTVTHVTGTVTDASNKETLPFVTIQFLNAGKGTGVARATDGDGKYDVTSERPYAQIKASFIGYKDAIINIIPGRTQTIDIKLTPSTQQLSEVEIKSGVKTRYRNKDNPAVELIRKVVAHKPQNRPENYPYLEYKEYDKMVFSLTNTSQKLSNKKFFRKYNFLLTNLDSISVPGKTLLPLFIEEKALKYLYRKNPEKEKTTVLGEKGLNFGASVDSEGLGQYFKHMYAKVDIYDNNIFLMTNNFLSPIADEAPLFYKFFITDTIAAPDNKSKLIELSFTPRNTQDMMFEGKIYVTLDSNYAVQKVKMGVNRNINLNFVKSMTVDQSFEQNPDGRYHLSQSRILADFGLTKKKEGGLFGMRTITYGDYIINKPHPDTTYNNQEVAVSDEAKHRSESFWQQNRLDTLSKAESKVYKNIDSLTKMPSFRRTLDIATLLFAGYKSFDTFEVGPSNTFYSFNPVEGVKLRLGGRTTPELSKRYYFETYAAYGTKDERWKYFLSATYSLNDKSIYRFPQNYLRASFQRDTKIPGASLQFVQQDNFLLSFKRGVNDKYLYNDFYKLDYVHEFNSHFSYSLTFKKWTQEPAGSLYFINNTGRVNDITTTETSLNVRYAPNEQYYQGKIYRTPIPGKYPIFSVDYAVGLKNLFGGQYNYQSLHARIDKRVYLSQLGYSDVFVEAGRIFGQVPYPLLNIFRANQTYAYDLYSYNLMNFLEFVSDRNVGLNIDQHFMGFFLNKIPLFKKLKLREVASFKGVYGSVGDQNNPALNPSLFKYPVTATNQPITYVMGNEPYIEGSVGVENIFKFIRVDLVRRFTYLDHPEVSQYGIRARVKFDF